MHVIESDATIVASVMILALLEAMEYPEDAERLIARAFWFALPPPEKA